MPLRALNSDQARAAASSLHRSLSEHYDRAIDPIRNIYQQIEKDSRPLTRTSGLEILASQHPPITHVEYAARIRANAQEIGSFVTKLREAIRPLFSSPPSFIGFVKNIEQYKPPESVDISQELAKLDSIDAKLSRWHRDVSRSDRRWHDFLDRWPVVILFAAATMATALVCARVLPRMSF